MGIVVESLMLIALSELPLSDMVEWHAPEECPQVDFLQAELDKHLRDPLDSYDNVLRVRGEVRPVAGIWELELLYERHGTVEHEYLSGADCWQLAALAGGLIAIAVDPLALGAGVTDEGLRVDASLVQYQREQPVPVQLPLSKSTIVVERASSPPEPTPVKPDVTNDAAAKTQRATRGLLSIGGGAILNLFPNVAGSADLRGGIKVHWAQIMAVAQYTGGGRYFTQDRSRGAELSAWGFGLEGCGAPVRRIVEFHLCLGLTAGGVHARGFGALVSPNRSLRPWLWPNARAELLWVVTPVVTLFVTLGTAVSAVRPAFLIDNDAGIPDSYELPWVQGFGTAGVRFRLHRPKAEGTRR
jgi:hypothetical protein